MNDFRNESKESILTKIELLNGTILMGTHARNHFKQLFLSCLADIDEGTFCHNGKKYKVTVKEIKENDRTN